MARKPYLTKPGRHGTLYRFRALVTPGCPGHSPYHTAVWAYSEDHAAEILGEDEMLAGDDWEIVGRAREAA